jgi:hypothetical protein
MFEFSFLVQQAFGMREPDVLTLKLEEGLFSAMFPDFGGELEVSLPLIWVSLWLQQAGHDPGPSSDHLFRCDPVIVLAFAMTNYEHLDTRKQLWLKSMFGLHLDDARVSGRQFWHSFVSKCKRWQDEAEARGRDLLGP